MSGTPPPGDSAAADCPTDAGPTQPGSSVGQVPSDVNFMATCTMNHKMSGPAISELQSVYGDSLLGHPVWRNGKMFYTVRCLLPHTASHPQPAAAATTTPTPTPAAPLSIVWGLHSVERVFLSLCSLSLNDLQPALPAPAAAIPGEGKGCGAENTPPPPPSPAAQPSPSAAGAAAPAAEACPPKGKGQRKPKGKKGGGPQQPPPPPLLDPLDAVCAAVRGVGAEGWGRAEGVHRAAVGGFQGGASAAGSAGNPMGPPRFKVFCKRKGSAFDGNTRPAGEAPKRDRALSREDIAAAVGGAIQDITGWAIDLRNPTLHIHCTCSDEGLFLGLLVARQSATSSYLGVTGETGLHPTVSWFMARCANPSPGDTLVDLCCGRGVILSEAASRWPQCHYIGVDLSGAQLGGAARNFKAATPARHNQIDLIRGDLRLSIFRPESVSAVVADLPFGKQHGSLEENLVLYPAALKQCERVLSPGGTLVLITSAANAGTMKAAVAPTCFQLVRRRWLRLGLLDAHIYVFRKPDSAGGGGAAGGGGDGASPDCAMGNIDWADRALSAPFPWEGRSWAETYALERPGMVPG